MSTSVAIKLESLTKRYGKDRGIEDVTFEVRQGQVFGFLGPNGAGKSTAMRLLVGLIEPTSGSASIMGKSALSHDSKILRDVGYLPGALALYKNLTGREYLRYLSKLRKVDCTKQISSLADRFDLDLDRHIHDQSKGNRQKIGVVQAFMHQPHVLILDEPTSGLDPLIQREFESLLDECKARGAAILLSSHVLSEVENLADQIAVISEGKILINQNIQELKSHAKHTITLTFPKPVDRSRYEGITEVISLNNNILICSASGPEATLLAMAVEDGVLNVRTEEPSLDRIFLELIDREGKR